MHGAHMNMHTTHINCVRGSLNVKEHLEHTTGAKTSSENGIEPVANPRWHCGVAARVGRKCVPETGKGQLHITPYLCRQFHYVAVSGTGYKCSCQGALPALAMDGELQSLEGSLCKE